MIRNVYEGFLALDVTMTVSVAVEICSSLTKTSIGTVYKVLKAQRNATGTETKTETSGRKRVVLDDDTKNALRRTVHAFYFRNELPTLAKIHNALKADDSFPHVTIKVIRRTLHEMNFRFAKRNRKSALIEKSEIVTWRRKYLTTIRALRRANTKIYYMDETWVNAYGLQGVARFECDKQTPGCYGRAVDRFTATCRKGTSLNYRAYRQ